MRIMIEKEIERGISLSQIPFSFPQYSISFQCLVSSHSVSGYLDWPFPSKMTSRFSPYICPLLQGYTETECLSCCFLGTSTSNNVLEVISPPMAVRLGPRLYTNILTGRRALSGTPVQCSWILKHQWYPVISTSGCDCINWYQCHPEHLMPDRW